VIFRNTFPDSWHPVVGMDIECTCKSGTISTLYRDDIVTVQVASGSHVYVLDGDPISKFRKQLCELVSSRHIVKLFHNSVFDLGFLMVELGVSDVGSVWDTMLVERVLTAGTNEPCDLKSTAWRRADRLIEKDLQNSFTTYRLTDDQVKYAAEDAEVLLPIYEAQKAKLEEENLRHVADLENDLAPVVAGMEVRGVGFNNKKWSKLVGSLTVERDSTEQQVQRAFNLDSYAVDFWGRVSGVNLNSPTQLLDGLARLGIKVVDTKASTMEGYAVKHPEATIVGDILRFRDLDRRISFDYTSHVNPATGRIHAKFNQLGSRAGRFSSSNPNLQQVPAEERFRSCFIAPPGKLLVTVDYSQQEMRIMAQASGDKNLIKVCQHDDIHVANARVMYKDPDLGGDDKRRNVAKNAGFAWMYGSGAETLAQTAHISVADAGEAMQNLWSSYPGVDRWSKRQLSYLFTRGWVETLFGRKRWIPGAMQSQQIQKFSRIARNTPIQGTGADMVKMALVEIDKIPGVDIVLSVHDEMVAEVPEDGVEDCARAMERCMVEAGERLIDKVPVLVEWKVARTWVKP
jgi:DNA polymerase-1